MFSFFSRMLNPAPTSPYFVDEEIPTEMKAEIAGHLPLKDLVSLSEVNTKSYSLVRDNALIWRKKTALHFPDVWQRNKDKIGVDWQSLFSETYQDKYINLDKRAIKLFSLIKEGDYDQVLKKSITLEDMAIKDEDHESLIQLIANHRNKRITEYFYNHILLERENQFLDRKDYDSLGHAMVHWLVIFDKRQELFDEYHDEILRPTSDKITVVELAARFDRFKLIELLLKHDKKLNTGRAVYFAAQVGNTAIIDLLIRNGAHYDGAMYNGFSPLCVAALFGHVSVVRRLIQEKNININFISSEGSTPLYLAAQNGHHEICRLLINAGADASITYDGNKPFYIACKNGHINVLHEFTVTKPDLDEISPDGTTALYTASELGHAAVVEFLCQHGARTDILFKGNLSPLIRACQNNDLEVVNILVSYGANVNQTTLTMVTPIFIAGNNGHFELLCYLIKNGADLNRKLVTGETLLHIICRKNYTGADLMIGALLCAGADPTITDAQGMKPSDIAEGYKIPEMLRSHEKYFMSQISRGVKRSSDNNDQKDHESPALKRFER